VLGRLRRKVVRKGGYEHVMHYITLSSNLIKGVSTFREIVERGYVTIKLLNEVFTSTVAKSGPTYYLLIPHYIARRHPELDRMDYVEYEVVS